jgi:hypothetical protein
MRHDSDRGQYPGSAAKAGALCAAMTMCLLCPKVVSAQTSRHTPDTASTATTLVERLFALAKDAPERDRIVDQLLEIGPPAVPAIVNGLVHYRSWSSLRGRAFSKTTSGVCQSLCAAVKGIGTVARSARDILLEIFVKYGEECGKPAVNALHGLGIEDTDLVDILLERLERAAPARASRSSARSRRWLRRYKAYPRGKPPSTETRKNPAPAIPPATIQTINMKPGP